MFIKIVSPIIHLPHRISYQGKDFVWPAVKELPSICPHDLPADLGKGLLQKSPAFAAATDEEVEAERKILPIGPLGLMADPEIPKGEVAVVDLDSVIVGTITAADVLAMKKTDLQDFIAEASEAFSGPVLHGLLTLANRQDVKVTKGVAEVLNEACQEAEEEEG